MVNIVFILAFVKNRFIERCLLEEARSVAKSGGCEIES